MSTEVKSAIDALNRAFEEFKAANDERIKQLETRGSADGALTEKVERLNGEISKLQSQLTEVELQANRRALGPDGRREDPAVREHREAFNRFMRKGVEDGLGELAVKAAVQTGVDADGGYAVPEELDRQIASLLVEVSPMRQLAAVKQVGAGYKKLINTRGTASGWVGETAARPETDTPTLADVTPPQGEIYANPFATQRSLDDIFFDVEAWLAGEVVTEFSFQEGVAFVTGDGTNRPKGFLTYPTAATADGTRPFGTLQAVNTGAAADLGTAPLDALITLVYAMKAGHRRNASWLANALTYAELRKVKDANDNYIWQPSAQAGQPATLLGYAAYEDGAMPDIAADALPVAFGDWRAGYEINDIRGTRVLRDPYSNKPYVGFYTTKRVGGGVVNSEAIKLLKVAE